jgi:hypothetical protein
MNQQLQENRVVTPANEATVREVLRGIAEMVVYGDSKSELLFEYVAQRVIYTYVSNFYL